MERHTPAGRKPLTATLTLVGGPTLVIEVGGLRLLTDPAFDPPQRYHAAVTLVKQTGPAIEADAVLPVDAVLLSHDQHFDNLDHAGRALLPRVGRVVTTSAGAARLRDEVPRAEGLMPWQSVTLVGPDGRSVRVTATPARHGPHGFEPISGDVIGFIISGGTDTRSIYVSGDTVWYEGVAEVARRFDVGLAILFAGAARPRGAFHVTFDNNDVVEVAAAFSKATIITIHNEGWAHFSETQEDVVRLFETLGIAARLRPLQRGIPTTLEVA